MNKKNYNPLVGTEFLKRQFSKIFFEKFSDSERVSIQTEIFGGRSLDDVLQLTPETPLADYLLLLVALRGKLKREINLTWPPADFMVMRHTSENLEKSTMLGEWEEAKQAFIASCGDREPSPEELADYDNPDPKFLSEPDWLRDIPLSKD